MGKLLLLWLVLLGTIATAQQYDLVNRGRSCNGSGDESRCHSECRHSWRKNCTNIVEGLSRKARSASCRTGRCPRFYRPASAWAGACEPTRQGFRWCYDRTRNGDWCTRCCPV